VGVLVTDILPPSPRSLARAANATLRRLRSLGAEMKAIALSPSQFDLVRDQLGDGYGAPTAAAQAAVESAAHCGIHLETTYTGKTLAGLRERVRRGPWPDRPVLFWNTYHAVDAAARAPRPLDPEQLPVRFRRFFEEDPALDR
jgi:hypothetical protein